MSDYDLATLAYGPKKTKNDIYVQMPVSTWSVAWTKEEVDDAIQAHEQGSFQASALLSDHSTRLAVIDSVLSIRVDGLLGLPNVFTAATTLNGDAAKKAWEKTSKKSLPKRVLRELMKCYVMMGFAVAQLWWEADENEWSPRLEFWHPQFVTYYEYQRKWVAQTATDGMVEITPGDGWFMLRQSERGFMNGAIRSIGPEFLKIQYADRDWMRWSETYSLGLKKISVPADADASRKKRFFNSVASAGSEMAVLIEKSPGSDGADYDVEIEHASGGAAADGFEPLIASGEKRCTIRVLGQNLSTDVSGGSFAAASVHENVKATILQSDAEILPEECGTQIIQPWADMNFGSCDDAPLWTIDATPPRGKKEKAEAAEAEAKAAKALQDVGVPIDGRKLGEEVGAPMLEGASPITDEDIKYGLVTINQVRRARGWETVPWGDVPVGTEYTPPAPVQPPAPLLPPAPTQPASTPEPMPPTQPSQEA